MSTTQAFIAASHINGDIVVIGPEAILTEALSVGTPLTITKTGEIVYPTRKLVTGFRPGSDLISETYFTAIAHVAEHPEYGTLVWMYVDSTRLGDAPKLQHFENDKFEAAMAAVRAADKFDRRMDHADQDGM